MPNNQFKKCANFILSVFRHSIMNFTLVLCLILSSLQCIAGGSNGSLTYPGPGFLVETMDNDLAARIYISNGKQISCVDAQNGKLYWSLKTPYGSIDVGPILVGRMLIYIGGGGHFTIYGVDADTGAIKWSKEHRASILASGEGKIFVNTQFGNGIASFNAITGEKVWEYHRPGPGTQDRLMYSDGNVYTTNYVLDAKSGKAIRTHDSPIRALGKNEHNVFSVNEDGKVAMSTKRQTRSLPKINIPVNSFPAGIASDAKSLFVAIYNGYPDQAKTGCIYFYSLINGLKQWKYIITTKNEMGLPYNPINYSKDKLFLSLRGDSAHGMILEALNTKTRERMALHL